MTRTPYSEAQAWAVVSTLASEIVDAAVAGDMHAVIQIARDLRERVKPMQRQLAKGIHANPPLVVFGNPGRHLISRHVMALVYRHATDGQLYVHGFGDADIEPVEEGGALILRGLKTRTQVGLYGHQDGSVCLRGLRGQRLWADL